LGGIPPITPLRDYYGQEPITSRWLMPERPRNLIAPQLRRIRNERGMSQAKLAALCQRKGWDVSRDIIKHIESQTRWVSDIELVMLASILAVPVDALLPPVPHSIRLARAYLRT
jgi:transcriptional regulator with XRE-family HTH domain